MLLHLLLYMYNITLKKIVSVYMTHVIVVIRYIIQRNLIDIFTYYDITCEQARIQGRGGALVPPPSEEGARGGGPLFTKNIDEIAPKHL